MANEPDRTPGPGPDTEPLPAPVADTDDAGDERAVGGVLPMPYHGRRRTAARVALGLGRSVLALVAVGVLVVTGYNWSALRTLDQGIARTDVFGNDTTSPDGSTSTAQIGRAHV